MAKGGPQKRRRVPAMTREAREDQLIALAYDLAEKKLLDGTAPTQIIAHYLRLGSTRELLEREKVKKTTELLAAKTESVKTMAEIKDLYEQAMEAMSRYSGSRDDDISS